jgi:CheY-like chemotaxis protein
MGEDILLVCDLAPDAPGIRADRPQIEQVVMNLAINGRDAMPEGGTLTITTRRVQSAVNWPNDPLLEDGTYLLIEVRDTGSGIDPKILPYIFEPFFTTKPEGKGTGLGLAMVHGIVEQAGGTIRVTSLPGEGARFQVLLPPAAPPEKATESQPESLPTGRGHGELILVVEDDPTLLQLIGRLLRAGGYRVVAASEPEQARRLALERRSELALVVSDVVMPGESGPELLTSLRTELPRLGAVFVSGYTGDRLKGKNSMPSNSRLVHKPFTNGEILLAVASALTEGADSERAPD